MTDSYSPVEFKPKKATREEWDLYHAYRRIRHQDTRPDDPVTPDELVEKSMKRDDPFGENKTFVIISDGRIVSGFGAGVMKSNAPGYESNKQYLWGGGGVLTDYRRKGIGTIWLSKAHELMTEWDRSVWTIWGVEEDDGHAFMKTLGAEQKVLFAENRLDFRKVDWDLVARWIDEGISRNADVKLEMFEDRVPEDFYEEYSPILSELLNTMPFDDLDHGEIVITPETMRDDQERFDDVGRKIHTLVARLPDGRLAGMTDVGWNSAKPNYIDQRFTGVHPDARGRGLGKLTKAYMLNFLKARYEDIWWVVTGNAESNAPMLAINKALGFFQYKLAGTYQISRDDLAKYLASA